MDGSSLSEARTGSVVFPRTTSSTSAISEHPGMGPSRRLEDSMHRVRRLFTHFRLLLHVTQLGLHLGFGKSLHDILRSISIHPSPEIPDPAGQVCCYSDKMKICLGHGAVQVYGAYAFTAVSSQRNQWRVIRSEPVACVSTEMTTHA